jgi:hypothetical protein
VERDVQRGDVFRSYRALAIQRIAQWVDHASQQTVSHGHVHHAAGTLDLVACVQVLVVPEQDDTDLFFIQVECDAKQTAREHYNLFVTNTRKSGKCRDSGRDFCDDAHFMRSQLRREVLATLTQHREGLLNCGLQDSG